MFNIDQGLIKEVKLSCSKYEVDWKTKALIKAQEAEKNKKKEDLTKQVEATKAQEWLDAEIVKCKSSHLKKEKIWKWFTQIFWRKKKKNAGVETFFISLSLVFIFLISFMIYWKVFVFVSVVLILQN